MGSKIGALLLVVAIPAFGYWAANGSQGLLDTELRQAIQQEYPSVDDERVSRLTVDDLCDEAAFAGEQICQTADILVLMEGGSIASGAVGLLLVTVIWLAGRLARFRRRVLLYVFKPGLYLTALVLVALVITYAGITIGAVYYGESLLVGRVHVGLMLVVGLGALGGVWAILSNVFRVIDKAEVTVIGTGVSRDDAPRLWQTVDQLADSIGSLVPDQIVLGVEPNFFVTEGNVVCLDGTLSGRTLYCSLPLMRIMREEEAKAVLVHELAHFKGEDTRFSQRFYPIYRGTQDSIESLLQAGGTGWRMLVLLPAVAIFRFFLDSFSRAERALGRSREVEADAEAASLLGANTVGSALAKIHAFSGAWPVVQEQMVELLQSGQMFENVGAQFAATVEGAAAPNVLEGVTDDRMAHPTDTHPPLAERLEALSLSVGEVKNQALHVTPDDAAYGLVDRADELENEISDAYQVVIAQRLGIGIPAGSAGEVE